MTARREAQDLQVGDLVHMDGLVGEVTEIDLSEEGLVRVSLDCFTEPRTLSATERVRYLDPERQER